MATSILRRRARALLGLPRRTRADRRAQLVRASISRATERPKLHVLREPAASGRRIVQAGRITRAEICFLILLAVLIAALLYLFPNSTQCREHPPAFLKGTVFDCASQAEGSPS